MRILLLACRDLTGPLTGRKQVLWTALRCLRSLGHELHVAMFAPHVPDQAAHSTLVESWQAFSRPAYSELATNVAWRGLTEQMSLNECLFYSPRILRELKTTVVRRKIDFVVCDMLRMAPYASQLDRPWHLDLDDLLSQRYLNLSQQSSGNDQVAGYYGAMLPKPLRVVASWAGKALLPMESRRIARRELQWSREANSISLVSPLEAQQLSQRIGRTVFGLPMQATFPPADFTPPADRSLDIVFLGGLDYQPNLDAMRYYRDSILPELKQRGGSAVCHVVGKKTEAAERELRTPDFQLVGYAENLATELCRHALFIAPITHGTGIKTKVLDAMAHGLAVVSTPLGIEGIGAIDGEHCRVATTPQQFADITLGLLSDPSKCTALGRAAMEYVRSNFSTAVIAERWRQALNSAVPPIVPMAGESSVVTESQCGARVSAATSAS